MIETQFLMSRDSCGAGTLTVRPSCTDSRHRGDVVPPAIRIGRELRFRLEDVEAWEQARLEGDHAA